MQKIYLVCGVPGSGKSWVCEQLTKKFNYLRHDDYQNNYAPMLIKEANDSSRPVLADCPFAERELRATLENSGCEVVPLFIVEHPETVKERYERRGKPIPQSFYTRATTIANRANEWNAKSGTSGEILEYLKGV